MRESSARFLLALGFGALFASAVVARLPAQAGFRVHSVSDRISYIEGAGGNIGVLKGEGGLLLIDDQLKRASEEVQRTVMSISDKPVEFLLNTHWHGDHTGNNDVFAASTILAHENVRRRLADDPTIEGNRAQGTLPGALPDLTFQQSIKLYWGGEEMEIVHYPHAHTDGDSVVFFETSKVVHMGDIFFAGRFPFIDVNSGGGAQGVVDAVGRVLERIGSGAGVKIIPGHGGLSTVEDLRAYHEMLLEVTARVKEALSQGQSADDMKAGGLVDDYAPEWGTGFVNGDAFLETLAGSLGG